MRPSTPAASTHGPIALALVPTTASPTAAAIALASSGPPTDCAWAALATGPTSSPDASGVPWVVASSSAAFARSTVGASVLARRARFRFTTARSTSSRVASSLGRARRGRVGFRSSSLIFSAILLAARALATPVDAAYLRGRAMLRIKRQQMGALAERDFVATTAVHLGACFPRHRAVAGDPGLREVARRALDRARVHGLVAARSATTLAELMCLLGAAFDDDPMLPWAQRALTERAPDEAARVDRLHAIAMRHLDIVAPDAAGFAAAIAAARAEANVAIVSGDDARARVTGLLSAHFSRKCALLGTECVGAVSGRAVDQAQALGAATVRGAVALGGLAAALGSGVLDDPLVRPLGEALRDPRAVDAAERVDLLFAALRHVATAWSGLASSGLS